MYGMGPHIDLDAIVLVPELRQAAEKFFNAVYPKVITTYSTNRVDLGLALLDQWHQRWPLMRIVWRLMDGPDGTDNGRDASMGHEAIYAKFRPHHVRYPFLTFMAGNESDFGPDDLAGFKRYVDNTANLLELAGKNDMRIAYFTASTGTYAEDFYQHTRPVFEVNARYGNGQFHALAPHEYTGQPGETGGNSHMARYKRFWDVCDSGDSPLPRPFTYISEFGLMLGFDSEAGWRDDLSGVAHEAEYIDETCTPLYRTWHQPFGVPVNVFLWPPKEKSTKWGRMSVGQAALDAIVAASKEKPDPVTVIVPEVPTIPRPAPRVDVNPGIEDDRWTPATAQKQGDLSVNIRLSPEVNSNVVGKLHLAMPYKVHVILRDDLNDLEHERSQERSTFWWPIKLSNNVVGWVRDDVVRIVLPVDDTPTEPIEPVSDDDKMEDMIRRVVREELERALDNAMQLVLSVADAENQYKQALAVILADAAHQFDQSVNGGNHS